MADSLTIFALSSGAPPSAIAVVRVSGPAAFVAGEQLAGSLPPPRSVALRTLSWRGDPIDRGLVLRFPAGASATGENVVEFHVHGGSAVVARLLTVLGTVPGLRLAEPGEFSRRAVLNGVMDLNAAEGLADLLAAETEQERRAALAIHGGALGERLEAWRVDLLACSAAIEAMIDHEVEDIGTVHVALARLSEEMSAVAAGRSSESLRAGIAVVLAGPPNSGKSSLLNALAGRQAAIVTPIAGTTRDLVEVPVVIGGVRYRLIDSAGVRETNDSVEWEGVTRARQAIQSADLLLWLGDDEPPEASAPVLPLHARCDLPGRSDSRRLAISSLTGVGLDDVRAWLVSHAGAQDWALSIRQRSAVATVASALVDAIGEADLLIAAEHLRAARGALDRLSGRAGLAEVMDEIFSRFCLGK